MCADVVSIQPVFLVSSLSGIRYSSSMESSRIDVIAASSIDSNHSDVKFDTIARVSNINLREMNLAYFANIAALKAWPEVNNMSVL